MNLIRSIISLFLTILVLVTIAGWIWAGGQPSPQQEGARFVLGFCGVASLTALILLWREKEARVSSP